MRLSDNRLLIVRHLIFAAFIVLAAVIQQTDFFFSSVGGARLLLLAPVTVATAMNERSMPALFLGLLAGILWDSSSVTVDGFYAVLLACIGFGCCVLVILKLRNNLYSCLLLSFLSLLTVVTVYWLVFFVMSGYESCYYVYMKYYLSSAVYSMLFVLPVYYLVKLVVKITTPERKRINY